MRLYPDLGRQRVGLVARDLAVVLALVVFGKIALEVHDAVDKLAVLGEGVESAGGAVSSGFEAAADAVDGTPVVGDDIADGLRGAGEGSGGEVEDLGRGGAGAAHDLANLLGILFFALPASLLLLWAVPPRVRQIRRLNAAARVLQDPTSPERRELLAARAAFGLPYGTLLEYTKDPIGDLQAGRFDALVRAELEQAGLRLPR
ncbi:MAG: hypothetical protein MSC30_03620 [Gaiellaceae bacterium MAG52_C11]|nr:hypothetical protein [Candidatus Gaiellasilicea maunaloa]